MVTSVAWPFRVTVASMTPASNRGRTVQSVLKWSGVVVATCTLYVLVTFRIQVELPSNDHVPLGSGLP
jgi:hypothetical protein